ncbi:metallophosphoesterase family protein [Deinococcus ruber]|uniref:Calcineurin-like phosphoesterase domain-containing protein n=1 Tax=Deinococcus ruber TaxID=1848197 RepID=A0A918CLB5_9DEIO|nr:DNA repair exonuclease [Deinococcus ruber]GGR30276.1 hypothetical protein GCM10008957_46340 [Deinococcus ruber]
MTPIRIVHIADIHLGFTGQGQPLVEDGPHAGRPLREVDVEQAVTWLGSTILEQDPPVDLVLIAGDLFHRANPLPHAIAAAAQLIVKLRGAGIEVVIIDGNHDTPRRVTHGSPAKFLGALGARVISETTSRIGDHDWNSPRLRNVVIHAVPSSVDAEQYRELMPEPGRINILLAHGRQQGTLDSAITRGDTVLSSDLLRRGWTYAALGDWHAHRHQPLADAPAYYAGSLEALTFGEAQAFPPQESDPYAQGGMLLVTVDLHTPPRIETVAYPDRRPVLHLGSIDARHLSAHEILDELERRMEGVPANALCTVDVQSISSDVYGAHDPLRIRSIHARCVLLYIDWNFRDDRMSQSDEPAVQSRLEDQWRAYVAEHVEASEDGNWLIERGLALLEQARISRAAHDEGE